jgi:DNA-binding protein H-NS
MDLTGHSLNELRRLQGKIDAEIKRRATAAKKDLLKKMQKMAADAGVSLDEVVRAPAGEVRAPAAAAKKKVKSTAGIKVPVKYRHPENAELAWTGRGRKPKWVEDWIASGKTLDQIAV